MTTYLLYIGLIIFFLLVSLGVRVFVSWGVREYLQEREHPLQGPGE